MDTLVSCDLTLGLGDQNILIRGENSELKAEFSSLSSLRQFQRTLPRSLPDVSGTPFQGLISTLEISVELRGRRVATVRSRGGALVIHRHWLALLRSLLPG